MKTEKATINVLKFENGHVLLGYNQEKSEYHILMRDRYGERIAIYTIEEMEDIYEWNHSEMLSVIFRSNIGIISSI
jgi:hypothetical protein